MKRHLPGLTAIALVVCLAAFSSRVNAQIVFTFDHSADLTNNFNCTNPHFTVGGTSGINGTSAVQNPFVGYNYSQVDLWTSKTGVPAAGGVFTVSACFYNNSDGGYAGLGFATAASTAPVGKGETTSGLGMLTHAGGGFFTNDAVESSVNYPGNQLANGNWYQIIFTVTRTDVNTYDLEYQLHSSNATGATGALLVDEVAHGVVNAAFGAATMVYPYFSAEASRMSLIDNFTQQLLPAAPAGTGAVDAPYLVANVNNLLWISQNNSEFAKAFKQTADINAYSTIAWNGGTGWMPIGDWDHQFSGTYDGNGKTVSGLYVNRGANNTGFIGITSDGAISNLGVVDVNFQSGNFAGGLVGSNAAAITNCYSTGIVHGWGTAGGLLGESYVHPVTYSYSTCDVSGFNETGGLIGGIYVDVSNCYSRGNVTRVSSSNQPDIGAFVGGHWNGNIQNSYSTGRVFFAGSGDPTANGFVGEQEGGTFAGDFWDTETSLQSTSAGGAVGLTTTLMKTQSTFIDAGWAADDWNLDAGVNDGYPCLKWQNPTGSPLPIQLASFTAVPAGSSSVSLLWKTASEVNNYGFFVERSASKSAGFTAVSGLIPGHGTSTTGHSYQYADKSAPSGSVYYRLKQVDLDNSVHYSDAVTLSTTGVAESAPVVFALSQNYPNPFNPSTQFRFSVAKTGFSTLVIYNAIGQEVSRIFSGVTESGKYYTARLDGTGLASGVYFARLRSGIETQMKKIVLMK